MLKDPLSARAATSHCYFLIQSELGRIPSLFLPSPGQCFDFKLIMRLLYRLRALLPVGGQKGGFDPAVKKILDISIYRAFRYSIGSQCRAHGLSAGGLGRRDASSARRMCFNSFKARCNYQELSLQLLAQQCSHSLPGVRLRAGG